MAAINARAVINGIPNLTVFVLFIVNFQLNYSTHLDCLQSTIATKFHSNFHRSMFIRGVPMQKFADADRGRLWLRNACGIGFSTCSGVFA
jgi:hypothetical protein